MTIFHQLRSTFAFTGTKHLRAVLMFAAVLMAIMPLHAQEKTKQQGLTSEQEEMHEAYQQAHADFMAVQQRLKQIQSDTLEAHPELQKQEQSFNELLMEEMKKKGHNPKQDLAEIEQLQQQLQNGDVPEGEREALMEKFQEKMITFRKAQSEALQTQKVQKAQGDLMGAMITAMKEQDPQTERLMQQMTQKRQELEQMLETANQDQ